METIDFYLRLHERLEIIAEIKNGSITSGQLPDELLPVSNPDNKVYYYKENGSTRIEFVFDPGFIDHGSVFIYTDNDNEIKHLDQKIKANDGDTVIDKLRDNWYREGF